MLKLVTKRCKGCGICVNFCPKKVCGQCEMRCPDYAIFVEK